MNQKILYQLVHVKKTFNFHFGADQPDKNFRQTVHFDTIAFVFSID